MHPELGIISLHRINLWYVFNGTLVFVSTLLLLKPQAQNWNNSVKINITFGNETVAEMESISTNFSLAGIKFSSIKLKAVLSLSASYGN